MNNHATIEKMKQMRLSGMVQVHSTGMQTQIYKDYTIDQYTAQLVDQEWESRQGAKIANLIKAANFRQRATIKDVDYTSSRNLDRNVFERLGTLDFLKQRENIIITGATGTGKSYLAQAIGNQACILTYKTVYFTMSKLMESIQIAKLEGGYHRLLLKLQKNDLLILDDFGLHSFDSTLRHTLMDILDYKYDQTSIIITSQVPVASWFDLIGEATIADAILDRLVNSSHRIDLKGESLRKNKLKNIKK